MEFIGPAVITVVMACAVAGAIASLFNDEEGLGKEFLEGLRAIGYIFIPVAGIMASVPYISMLVRTVFGRLFALVGADDAMAATTVIAMDMGGYHLAHQLKDSVESWVVAMMAGAMAGATIVFSIPVGLALLDRRDHKYMALGILSGVLSIPVGVLIASLLLIVLRPEVAEVPQFNAPATHQLELSFGTVLANLTPLVLFVSLVAGGLFAFPNVMIRGFMIFGRVMDVLIKLVLVASIVQMFSSQAWQEGVFTYLFGRSWRFAPIVADAKNRERALEIAGYIGMMLAGAFPMVYLMQKYLAGPIQKAGRWMGLSEPGAAGILAASANILAMFRLVREMPPKDKVIAIAFAVCAAFTFGDHLAFTANFQKNLLLPIMAGKLGGGVFAILLAYKLSVPTALKLEKQEMYERIAAALAEVPSLKGLPFEYKVFPEGMTNINCKVTTSAGTFMVRFNGAGTELLGIDREREVRCARAAAEAGVGPALVAYLPHLQVLISEFIVGKGLTPDMVHDPELLRRIARSIRRCHESHIPADLGEFSPFKTVRDYHALARERGVTLPGEFESALALFGRIEQELKTGEPPCLCHNDLLAGNFIDEGERMRIIDWEYAGRGDRFFDLGGFAVNHQLTPAEEEALLAAYFGEVKPEHLRRLRLMRLVSDLRESAWGFVQSALSKVKEPAYYLKYGQEHLTRFLHGAGQLGVK